MVNFTAGPYGFGQVVDSVDAAVMADFTGDGYADLVTLATSNQMFGGARIAVATAADVRNIGAGLTFGSPTVVTPNPQTFAGGTPMTVGDFNGDGRPEIALILCPQTPCSIQIFAVDPGTLTVSIVSSITLPGLTSGRASLAAGRFGATDHDQLVVVYQPASGNAIVATIDFDASLQPSLKAVAQDITGSAGLVKAGRLDWFSPYDYAVLVGGNKIADTQLLDRWRPPTRNKGAGLDHRRVRHRRRRGQLQQHHDEPEAPSGDHNKPRPPDRDTDQQPMRWRP